MSDAFEKCILRIFFVHEWAKENVKSTRKYKKKPPISLMGGFDLWCGFSGLLNSVNCHCHIVQFQLLLFVYNAENRIISGKLLTFAKMYGIILLQRKS